MAQTPSAGRGHGYSTFDYNGARRVVIGVEVPNSKCAAIVVKQSWRKPLWSADWAAGATKTPNCSSCP
jgi:hypothetical protein